MNTPAQIAEDFSELGVKKAAIPGRKLLLLAVLAGAFIAFAGAACTIAGAAVNKLAGASMFPGGLAMVILAGSELFTGDNLMIVSLLDRRITAAQLIRTLVLVYLGNFVGAFAVALLAVYGGTLGAFAEAVVSTAAAKATLGFGEAFVRGILCNILVCIAVWMAAAAKEPAGKILAVFFPITIFVLGGFEHCIANMYFIPAGLFAAARYGIAADGLTWSAFLLRNLPPVTLGNLVGGFAVGAFYWAIYLSKSKQTA